MSENAPPSRRTVLGSIAAVSVPALLAGCTGGANTPTADDGSGGTTAGDGSGGGSEQFGGWLSDVGNYDGVVDATGESQVSVGVGTEGNGGNYAFEPAAVRVDSGTTVVWEWTGKGSTHNVVAEDGSFESELTSEEGFTYERTFSETGTVKYLCEPHRGMGMKGVVVVE